MLRLLRPVELTYVRRFPAHWLRRIAAAAAVLWLMSVSNAEAQALGSIAGRVLDQTGAVLQGVRVALGTGAGEQTTTDERGTYRFDRVTAGSVEVTYRLLNFAVYRRSVTVSDGTTTAADVVMTLAINADVLVTAPATFRNVADVAHPAENLVGIAAAASQGAITARQLDSRPILRAGEVLETVPGLIVSQHSGEGKANQYYLRGFNLDHGTDFSTMVAGVPVNMPSGARAHGYSDSSFLIPELVSGVQFRTGPYFAGEGDSTDQVGERAIASGLIPRFGLIDSSDGGFSNRESIAAEIQRSMGQSSLRATGYLLHNSLNLFSNFTYFLDDPERGDQFQQSEERGATGGRVTYRRLGHVFEHHTEGAVGVQIRSDWLRPVGLHRTEGRARRSTTREDRVGQTMVGVYAQSEIEWTRVVRTTLGLRADVYQFSVSANDPANSGEGSTGLLSPKVGAVFGPWSGTELYANAGFGYHSNDLFDAEVADIDYFYASRLPGEPAEGVEDVHTHPAIPRTARVALEVSF